MRYKTFMKYYHSNVLWGLFAWHPGPVEEEKRTENSES